MRISQVIEDLQRIISEHGNLSCMAQDGLDPSDLADVRVLNVEEENGDKVVKIET